MDSVQEYRKFMRDKAGAFNYDPMKNKNFDPMKKQNFLPETANSDWGQIDIIMTCVGASPHILELFCPADSAVEVQSAAIGEAYTAAFQFSTGNAIFTYGVGTITISCPDRNYRALMNSMLTNPYRIEAMRLDVTTTAQIRNKFTPIWKSWLGGNSDNKLSVQAQKGANQFQNLIVDMATPLDMDQERGMLYRLEAAEVVNLSLFMSRYEKVTAY